MEIIVVEEGVVGVVCMTSVSDGMTFVFIHLGLYMADKMHV